MRKQFGAQEEDLQLQPEWYINTNFNETLTGGAIFVCESSFALGNNLRIGIKHPKDERLELINFNIVGKKNSKCEITCDYFGLLNTPTKSIWSYYNATNEEPIEAHPDFAEFAGSEGSELNGANFDPTTGAFLGFSANGGSFAGVRGYLDGKPTLRKTWYSDKAADGIDNVMKTFRIPSGMVPGLPSGANALKTNWGNNPIGNFFELWEEYSVSGALGWNPSIYKVASGV